MPRLTNARPKTKHVAIPQLVNGEVLVLRDRKRVKHYTDHVKPKISELKTDDWIAFREPGDFVRFGYVVSTTATEVFLKVREGAKRDGEWVDVFHDYRITAGAIIGYRHEYHRRIKIVEKLVGGRVYALGYRLDGVGAPEGWLTADEGEGLFA